MRLDAMLAGADYRVVSGDTAIEVAAIRYDSRQVRQGDIFFALSADDRRNDDNINDALGRGAGAVVVRRWAGGARPALTIVECERPRPLMGVAASRLYRAPSERLDLIGVTGTSGKTTTTYLLASIFEAAGAPAGIIGTIGTFVAGRKIFSGLTTPESVDFEYALSEMERAGVPRVASEVSSEGLAQGRVDALNFRACVFTNLGRDHLNYHGTLEEYFAAKLRLFTDVMPRTKRPDPLAVASADDPYGRRVLEAVRGRKLSFGLRADSDVHPVRFETGLNGIRASIRALGREIEITSPLLGEFNLLNILGASAVSVALGIGTDAVAEGVRRCSGAPGRMEAVDARPGVTILVDYAHKPDALEAVLRSLRALNPRRILCVFGCGGDRDRGKRPLMGEIAGRLADLPILTSDNPRTEDPLAIIADVEQGLSSLGLLRLEREASSRGYIIEPDRRAAIALSLRLATRGDVILIAGKGHEDYQIVGTRKFPFDDRAVVREAAAEIGAT